MSASSSPTTIRLWQSWPMLLASAPVQRAEALDEAAPDIAVDAMALEHGELVHALRRIGQAQAVPAAAALSVRCSVSSEFSRAPITGPEGPAAGTSNSSAATGARLIEP